MGIQNFFFVPRSWQDRKQISLFLYRALKLAIFLILLIKALSWSKKRKCEIHRQKRPRKFKNWYWHISISLLNILFTQLIDSSYGSINNYLRQLHFVFISYAEHVLSLWIYWKWVTRVSSICTADTIEWKELCAVRLYPGLVKVYQTWSPRK